MEKLDLNKGLKYDVWDNIIDKIVFISNNFELEWIIHDWKSFQSFLSEFSQKNNFLSEDIKSVEFKNNKVIIYTKDWKNYNFDFSEYKKEVVRETVWDIDIKALEEKTEIIEIAMESIFFDNDWIFDELNLNDKVDLKRVEDLLKKWRLAPVKWKTIQKTLSLLKPFEWKNLLELRKEIDLAEESLKKYYWIIWETKKSVSILERQISHYAWIGDRYEWWARLFAMNSQELDQKTTEIVNQKTVSELIEYIRFLNNKIDDNSKIDDMAKTMNQSVIENISKKTFEKIKSERSSNREIINFVQVITWRKITSEKNWKISEKNLEVSVFRDFKQVELSNKALVYLMYDRKIIDEISDKQKINLETDVFKWKEKNTVWDILTESLKEFENIWLNKDELIKSTWLDKLNTKEKISDMSFEETLLLASVYSISKDLKENLNKLKNKKPEEIVQFLQEKNQEKMKKVFKELNESLDKNFWATLIDWNWKSWKDFWLTWEKAEIFDLYWEINWRWLFNLADDNWFAETFLNSQTWVVMAVWMLTAMVVLSPAVMAAWWASLLLAWAKIWLTTTIASQLMDKKWYATVKEAVVWVSTQASIDIASSVLFTWVSWAAIWYFWPRFSNSFWKTLQTEMKAWNLATKTTDRLDDLLVEWWRDLWSKFNRFRWPKLWKPKIESAMNELNAFKQAWFSWQLSDKTIKYLWKYSAVSWRKWDIADAGIWLLDWPFSSFVWQMFWHKMVNNSFYESHYNPDSWETFENVSQKKSYNKIWESNLVNNLTSEEIKTQSKEVRAIIENNLVWNSELKKDYEWLSEDEKRDLTIFIVYIINSYKN